MRYTVHTLLLLATGLLIAACGGPPAENPMLIEARAAYVQAASDPIIVQKAPVALEEAKEALDVSERKFRNEDPQEEVTHYAYVAKQRVLIAEQSAKLNTAEERVKKAESERQEVLIEARAAEAERARREAEQALTEAEAARRDAQEQRQEADAAKVAAAAALAQTEELTRQIKELEAQQTERGLVLTLGDVLFDVGKATLKPGGLRAVEKLSQFLTEYPQRNVLIEGFTDSTGGEDFNLGLSQLRADAVKNALVNLGINASRIRTRGYGEDFPVATNATPAGRQQNRRVEVIISDEKGVIPARTQ